MLSNGTTKLANSGTYVANRFRAYDNIICVDGGDFNPPSVGVDLVRAVASAIRAVDPKWLHTFHGVRHTPALGFLSLASDPWLGLNDIYTSETDVTAMAFVEYARSSMPFFLIEDLYEGEGASEATVRQQAYQAVLSGSTGQVMGNYPIWAFAAGWPAALNSRGATTLAYLPALMAGRPWWTLVPDVTHTILTLGSGSGATRRRPRGRATVPSFWPTCRARGP
jgi:hypothetical protein